MLLRVDHFNILRLLLLSEDDFNIIRLGLLGFDNFNIVRPLLYRVYDFNTARPLLLEIREDRKDKSAQKVLKVNFFFKHRSGLSDKVLAYESPEVLRHSLIEGALRLYIVGVTQPLGTCLVYRKRSNLFSSKSPEQRDRGKTVGNLSLCWGNTLYE